MTGLPADSDPKNLIVNYIPTPVTDDDLRALFAPFGTIASARVIVDRVSNHPKGYGFVKFTTEEAAKRAMKEMNGYEVGNKRLRVTQANGPQNRTIQSYSDRVVQLQPAVMANGSQALSYASVYPPQAYTMVGTGAPLYAQSTAGLPTMVLAQPGVAQPPMYYQPAAGSTPIIIEVDGKPMQFMANGAVPPIFQQYAAAAGQTAVFSTASTGVPVESTQRHGTPASEGTPRADNPNNAPLPQQTQMVRPLQFVPFTPGNHQSDPLMHSSFQMSVGTSSQMPSTASMEPVKSVMSGIIGQNSTNSGGNVTNSTYNSFMTPSLF